MNRKSWILFVLFAVAGCADDASEQAGDTPSFAHIAESSELLEGLFDFYRDRKTGETYLAIRPDQIDQEFIYVSFVRNGVLQGGHFRGAYQDNKIISLRRHFNRIEFITENTAFYFDPASALSRSADANISKAVLAVQDIVAEDEENGMLLIKADDIFLSESLQQIKRSDDPKKDPAAEKTFELGNLSETKNKIYQVRSYPQNSDIFVDYVYENPAPVVRGERDVTDSRNVSVRVQHSFVKVPENDFQPRIDDPRLGFFTQYVTDLTSRSNAPYRDLITRWQLEKKDPDATLSEPVEPIVWWIENTTPVEYRDTIRDAVLSWNQSFRKAGFENAVQVKIQPDDAEWDAGDIRYNVLRWTSSPQPPFGGYGPSFSNPRTGQIIGADIMLEYVFVTNRVKLEKLVETIASGGASNAIAGNALYCSLGYNLHLSNIFGARALDSMGLGSALQGQLIDDSLRYLVLHETGHTLGLNHNMKASQVRTMDEISDQALVEKKGLSGSVMDYPAVNLASAGREQTRFYNVRPGPYDDWAIEFGYSPALDGADGAARRAALLNRSTEPELAFGNDADDMRAPGAGIDPRVNVNDMSADAVGYATERMALVDTIMGDLLSKTGTEGESYQELLNSYLILSAEFSRAAITISRYIGGVKVNRAMVGQPGADTPFVPVSLADQKRAMSSLRKHVFAADAFSGSGDLYSHLRAQRRSFDFYGLTEDPKLHALILTVHKAVLDHLLHPVVLARITDSRQYGNAYPLGDVVEDLTEAIFGDDLQRNVNTYRQNLQLEYVNRLLAMVSGEGKAKFDYPSQSVALYNLRKIENTLTGNRGIDAETRAHRANILYTIKRGLDTKT
jgi:uncharacterized protein DUF4953/uncharacterized protein DUF5117